MTGRPSLRHTKFQDYTKIRLEQVSKYKHNIFYLLLRITPAPSNHIKI